jgi:DNA-binding NtrC family response regulator
VDGAARDIDELSDGKFWSWAAAMSDVGDRMDATSGGLSILVVDDDEGMRQLLGAMLKRMNVDLVTEASSGHEALECLSTAHQPFNLVICDWEMPGLSGIDLFKQVHASNPKLPFLLVTGRADLESVAAAKKAGIVGYLVKPISPQQLRAKIAVLLLADR